MTSQRRSIPALNLLKSQHKNQIDNYHKPRQAKVVALAKEKAHRRGKEIIEDIERYATTKYPELKTLLKCESRHSKADMSSLDLGFTFTPACIDDERKRLASLKDEEARDFAALEAWYTAFLTSSAGGSDTQVFDVPYLRGVSAGYTNYYQSEYVL